MQCCKGKGYFCEICNSDDVIFSFQLAEVSKCKSCKALFHKQCFKKRKGKCPKVTNADTTMCAMHHI